jgi:hypothetical protein
MTKILTSILLILLLISACKNKQVSSKDGVAEITVKTDKENPMLLSMIFSEVHYTKLETNNQNPIGRIDKLILCNGRYFILDSKSVKMVMFDNDGNFKSQTNNPGRGPGEFLNIADFIVDSLTNNIELWDNGNRKVITMDQNGKFLKERSLIIHVENFCKLASNSYLYFACNYLNRDFFKNGSYNVIGLDSSNKMTVSYLPINDLKFLKSGEKNLFVKHGNGVNVTIPYDNQIYFVNQTECLPKYKILFTNYSLPDYILSSYKKLKDNDWEGISNGFRKLLDDVNANSYAMGIHNIFENDKLLFFQYRVTKIGTFTVVYNKLTKQVIVGDPKNDIDSGLFGEPLFLINDTLITYIYPSDLIKRLKSLESDKSLDSSNPKYIELKKLSSSLQESENPIIAKFVFKNF